MGTGRPSDQYYYEDNRTPDILRIQQVCYHREGDIQVLVGRKTESLPVVIYREFLGIELENVAKVWQEA